MAESMVERVAKAGTMDDETVKSMATAIWRADPEDRAPSLYTKFARAAIAALHAQGYKITKDDPGMLSIPEVSTDRPIGR